VVKKSDGDDAVERLKVGRLPVGVDEPFDERSAFAEAGARSGDVFGAAVNASVVHVGGHSGEQSGGAAADVEQTLTRPQVEHIADQDLASPGGAHE
jgi:hypothetical protein